MTLFRTEHKRNYTCINNFIFKDNRLSWAAKAIWMYAFTKGDDWIFTLGEILNQSLDDLDTVKKAIKELEDFQYLHRDKEGGADWVFYETPQPSRDEEVQP